jgi:hypothetical protein
MRRLIIIAAAVAIAVLGVVFIEGKPQVNACSGGPVGGEGSSEIPTGPQPSFTATSLGGVKHGKDSAIGD